MSEKYQKIIGPQYMEHFVCIGGLCEDTCCEGWYIPIDAPTYQKYKKVKDPVFKRRLEKEIVQKRSYPTLEHAAKIKLKNGKCAFLASTGLCDIYTALGQNYLSHTCTLYPRTINCVNDRLEYSLVCSCPEAARQIILSKDAVMIKPLEHMDKAHVISANLTIDPLKPKKWQDYFFELRAFTIAIMQNRNYSIEERIGQVGIFLQELEKYLPQQIIKKIPQLIGTHQKMLTKGADKVTKSFCTDEAKVAKRLIETLQILQEKKKIKSKRYKDCIEKTFLGLEIKSKADLPKARENYEKACSTYYYSFLKEGSYMLENYFVNYIFERCVPLDCESPSKSFRRMQLYYQLIKLHLVGILNSQHKLTAEDIIAVIQPLSKTFDHDDGSFEYILRAVQ